MAEKVELEHGLTPRVLIILVVLALITPWFSQITLRYSSKPSTYSGWFIGMFWIVLFLQLIGLINPKWKLTKGEIAVLFPVFMMVAGKHFTTRGIPTLDNVMTYLDQGLFIFPAAFRNPALQDYWYKMTPPYMFPKSLSVADALWYGTGAPWGELLVPMVYWTCLLMLFGIIQVCLVFALIGYPWIKEEKILFPYGVGSVYLVDRCAESPGTKKYKLFDLKLPETRIFWIGFAIGVLLSGMPMVLEVLPQVIPPSTFYFGHYSLQIPALATAIPGSLASGMWLLWLSAIWLLLPNDILYTFLIMYVVIGLIYRPLAVSMGLIPYTPGMEYNAGWSMSLEPFPYGVIANTGSIFGIAVWCLWLMRDRIKMLISILVSDILKVLRPHSGVSKPQVVEDGLPIRWPLWIGTISTIVWVIWYTVTGTPFIIAVLMTIFWFLLMIGGARIWGEIAHVEPQMPGTVGVTGSLSEYLLYPIGAVLGYWPSTVPPTGNEYAWFSYMINARATMGPQARCFGGTGYGTTSVYYKICSENRIHMGDAFKSVIIALLIVFPVSMIADVFFVSHGGGLANIYTQSGVQTEISNRMVLSNTAVPPIYLKPLSVAMYGAIGFITTIALYIIRIWAPWFPLNPVGVVVSFVFLDYAWINGLVIIVKLLSIRLFGTSRFQRYAMPIVGGCLIGTGVTFLFPATQEFIYCFSRFLTLYRP